MEFNFRKTKEPNSPIFFFVQYIMSTIGSRRQVWNGTAKRTSGGLTKSELIMVRGRIKSRSKHISAKKEQRLRKYGYGSRKGHFGPVRIGTKRRGKMRGGGASSLLPNLTPSGVDAISSADGTIVGDKYAGVSDSYMLKGGSNVATTAAPAGASFKLSGGRHRRGHRTRSRFRRMRRSFGMA